MKRIFLISILLFFLGTVYADGPRYRFKSRRALQSLWRKETVEKRGMDGYDSNRRKLDAREQNGEGYNDKENFRYGIVVENPFSNNMLENSDRENGDFDGGNYPFSANKTRGKMVTDGGFHPLYPLIDPGNPFIGGKTDPKTGQGEGAPPKPPVGEGLHILLILSAALIAIKKRLSN